MQLRIVLAPKLDLHPGWLRFESRLQSGASRAVLGTVISMTPGTISCSIDEEGDSHFVIHALDARDEAKVIERIRTLFEEPLLVLEGSQSSQDESATPSPGSSGSGTAARET